MNFHVPIQSFFRAWWCNICIHALLLLIISAYLYILDVLFIPKYASRYVQAAAITSTCVRQWIASKIAFFILHLYLSGEDLSVSILVSHSYKYSKLQNLRPHSCLDSLTLGTWCATISHDVRSTTGCPISNKCRPNALFSIPIFIFHMPETTASRRKSNWDFGMKEKIFT